MNYESIPNCSCGVLKTVISDQQRDWVMKFLMGSNDSYKALKAQILSIKHFPILNDVHAIIQHEEKRRHISSDVTVTDSIALLAKENFRDGGRS